MENENNLDETPAQDSPVDLAAAFRYLKEKDKQALDGAVPATEDREEPGSDEGEEAVGAPATTGGEEAPDAGGVQVETNDGDSMVADDGGSGEDDSVAGGYATIGDDVDLGSIREGLTQKIQQEAIKQTRQRFSEANIKNIDIDDLYRRDENTGRVEFHNPDDPDRPFESRYEAQQWVDAFNKQVNSRFTREAQKTMNELSNLQKPMFELLDFIPQYQKLSADEQEILEDLIEPYGIRNGNGEVVGYSISLPGMANQAKKIAKRFAKEQSAQTENAAQPVQKSASRPAMDIKTSGSGDGANAKKEPKNLSEAFKMLNEQKKEKQNGK